MPYEILAEAGTVSALLIILAIVIKRSNDSNDKRENERSKQYADDMERIIIQSEKDREENRIFVNDIINKYEKREDRLMGNFKEIVNSLKIMTDEIKDVKSEVKNIKSSRG